MDNQTVKADFIVQKIILITLAVFLGAFVVNLGLYQLSLSDPYVQQVISLNGNQEMGRAMFKMNCAGCHGLQADGQVGPSLRGVSERRSRVSLIEQVISGSTPPMPQFQASPQEMADILSYLETL